MSPKSMRLGQFLWAGKAYGQKPRLTLPCNTLMDTCQFKMSLMRYRLLPLLVLSLLAALTACNDSNNTTSLSQGSSTSNSQWPATQAVDTPPPLPEELRPLLELSGPVLDSVAFDLLATGTDPIAFGLTFQEIGDSEVLEYQLAAMAAQRTDGSRNQHVYHWYGHPHFNDQVAMVPVHFTNEAGLKLYGEIVLPHRGEVPPSDGPFPVILVLESLFSNVSVYRWWHQLFADAGYLVFAFDFSGQGHSEGTDDDRDAYRVTDASRALTWLLEESPVKNFIDAERIGVVGHSLGALTTLEVQAVDDRFKAAVAGAPIHEFASSFESADIPIMIQTGDHDGPVAPIPFMNPTFTRTVYDKLETDRAMIVAEAASHAQHTNSPLLPTPTWSREIAGIYSLAWMDYYLRGDESALDALLSSHPQLSSLHTSDVEIAGTRHVLREGSFGP